ncbi:MAG: SDR family oxidoreductase [Alphaproteobacteria bacterium]|nr:SDR family oxidoreductase [Alphaproteobacteria bacterium]
MKRVLITGAAHRIGAGIARDLAAVGWHVVIHYQRSEQAAQALVSEVREQGGQATAAAADLSDPDQASALVEACASTESPLTALINNAALFRYDRPDSMTAELWDAHQATNARAPALLARAFAAQLPADQTGCIVNLLDNKLMALNPDFFSYTASKCALLGVTETLAMALRPRIRVCGVAPGIALISGRQTPESFEISHRLNPLGRGCSVADLAAAVRFVLETPSFNGQILALDGGQSLWRLPRDVAFLENGPTDGADR